MKEIEMPLDYELGETLLKRAEEINKHLTAGTMPEPINNEMWCGNCAFAHICLPVQIGKEVEVDTSELSELLDRLEELKPVVKEYDEIDEQIKTIVEGREKILAGDWFVTGKYIEKKSYNIPVDIKAAYEKVTKYWRRKVQRVDTVNKVAA
jgi:hypothetical protein